MHDRRPASAPLVLDASIRLATWLSLAAVVIALAAQVAGVPERVVVMSVLVVGFAMSWARSGRQPIDTAVAVKESAAPRA